MEIKPITETKEEKSIPVSIEEKPNQADNENIPVDFESEDFSKKFVGEETKKSDADEANNFSDNEKETVINADGVEEIDLDSAVFAMDMFDTLLSYGCSAIAQDTSTSAYSISAANKKSLANQLSKIIAKKKVKLSPEMLFVFGMIGCYLPSIISAVQTRMEKNKKSKISLAKEKEIKEKRKNFQNETSSHFAKDFIKDANETKEDVKEENENENIENLFKETEDAIPVKRKKGRPSRGAKKQ